MDGSNIETADQSTAETAKVREGYMVDAKGNLIAEANVKIQDRLMDQTVRKIVEYGSELSEQIARFKGHTYDDIETFMQILRDEHGIEKTRSQRGNMTLMTFDGLTKVSIKIKDEIKLGAEIQIAKEQLDVLIEEWSEGASEQLRTLINSAFDTSKEGNINLHEILRLRRMEFNGEDGKPDPRWQAVQALITDSIRSIGSKSYITIHTRKKPDGAWSMLPLNLAKV